MSIRTFFRRTANIDPLLAIPILVLLAFGTVMVYSSSSVMAGQRFGDSMYFLKRHIVYLTLGVSLCLTMCLFPMRWWYRVAVPGVLMGAIFLVMTVFMGVKSHHATRWLKLGPIAFQASEFIKPFFVLFIAFYIARKKEKIREFSSGLLPILLTIGVLLALVLKQPDFGTAVTLAATALVMLYASGAKIGHLMALGLAASVGAYGLMMGAAYRKKRLLTYLNPWSDPQGSGFQIIQSMVAFQRGGASGQGLGDSSQKLMFLPEAHTDFIFSIIAEELGVWGTVIIIAAFLIIVIQGLRLAIRVKDPFASAVAVGMTTLIGLQAFFNMGVTMALLPTKGLTLPLVSYGGSSLISTLICVSLLFSMSASVSISQRMARRTLG